MRFEELNEFNGDSSYQTVNEYLDVWDDVLSNVKGVKKAASICSGGEVSFFNILPKVEDTLDCIDHSLASMYFAIGKYHIIEKLGSGKAHKLLQTAVAEWETPKRDEFGRRLSYGTLKETGPAATCRRLMMEVNEKLPTAYFGDRIKANPGYYGEGAIAPMYQNGVTLDQIKAFRRKRTKITFVHGDLNDLKERGPYDLVYLSNALEYSGRNGSRFPVHEWVKPGGYIALTSGRGRVSRGLPAAVADRVELVRRTPQDYNVPGARRNYGMSSWVYILLKNERDPNYKVPTPPRYPSYRY